MNKENKIISEELIEKLMTSLYEEHKDWSYVYNELSDLKDKQMKQNKYGSIDANLPAIFIYELIKRRVDVKDFSEAFKNLAMKTDKQNLEHTYHRFFYEGDREIRLSDYVKDPRYDNKFSYWENMSYIFLNLENKKVILEKENIPYLQKMLEHLPSDKAFSIYAGRFGYFCTKFFSKPKELLPLIEVINKNPAFLCSEKGKFNTFSQEILHDLSTYSYEDPKKANVLFYFLKKNLSTFEPTVFKKLIEKRIVSNQKEPRLDIDLAVLNLLICCEIDFFHVINKKYIDEWNCVPSKPIDKSLSKDLQEYYKLEPYFKLSEDICSTLSVGLDKKNFNFDLEGMDLNESLDKNFVYIKFLEIKLSNQQPVVINNDQINYLMQSDENNNTNYRLKSSLKIIQKHLYHYKLENDLPAKKNNNNRVKL